VIGEDNTIPVLVMESILYVSFARAKLTYQYLNKINSDLCKLCPNKAYIFKRNNDVYEDKR